MLLEPVGERYADGEAQAKEPCVARENSGGRAAVELHNKDGIVFSPRPFFPDVCAEVGID